MKYLKFFTYFILIYSFNSCNTTKKQVYQLTKNYKPDNKELYDKIVTLDSVFFHAYNTCDKNLDVYAAFYAEDIEFYHDNGGYMNSKKEIVEGTKNNICGKVTRELVKGSLEVYPIKDYGAVAIGLHRFINNQEPSHAPSRIGRFMVIWENKNNEWKIKKVVSLH